MVPYRVSGAVFSTKFPSVAKINGRSELFKIGDRLLLIERFHVTSQSRENHAIRHVGVQLLYVVVWYVVPSALAATKTLLSTRLLPTGVSKSTNSPKKEGLGFSRRYGGISGALMYRILLSTFYFMIAGILRIQIHVPAFAKS